METVVRGYRKPGHTGTIYVMCPFCFKEHHHGDAGFAPGDLGYRLSHCVADITGRTPKGGEYHIVEDLSA